MHAAVLEKFGGLDSLVIKNIPEPEPKAGYVVIEIKAFGINHAEMHMRRGEWAEAAQVIGIECVGLVKSCPRGEFQVGAKVAALMGGLGRTINGSYADDVAKGRFKAKPSRVFKFQDIREAHRVMEANEANGKMVVVLECE